MGTNRIQITGKMLFEYRQKHGLSQKNIADSIGLTIGSVSHWETSGEIPKDRQITLSLVYSDIGV